MHPPDQQAILLRLDTAFKVVLVVTAFAFLSCASSNWSAGHKLVGKWKSSQRGQAAEYHFAKDGTFTGRVISDGALVSDFSGKWSLRGDTIVYEYTHDRLGAIAAGTIDRYKLISTAADHYVIEAADGSRRTYFQVDD